MINLLVYVLIVCVVAGLIVWAVDAIPVPAPLNRIVKVVVTVIAIILVILALLNLVDGSIDLPGPNR